MWSQWYLPEQLKVFGVDFDMVERWQAVGYARVEKFDLNGRNDIYICLRDFLGHDPAVEIPQIDAVVAHMERTKAVAPPNV
jgi:hypothetical protein